MKLKVLAATVLATVGFATAATAFPPLTVEDVTRTTITVGNLDCNTRYEVRVRERVGSRWRDAQTVTPTTDACTTPPPPPPQCSDGVNNDPGEDSLVDFPNDPGCTSTTDNTELGNPPPPTGQYQTVPPDGGANYYGQFSNSLPTSADYFPIGVWGAYNQTQANRDLDAQVGINLYVWAADSGFYDQIRTDGRFQTLNTLDSPGGTEQAGWVLDDEIDMTVGPSGCSTIQQRQASITDGRAGYANYGKGIFPGWETDAQFRCFVEAQDLQSDDIYWFSDPNVCDSQAEGASLFGVADITETQCRRASNYGAIVERMRFLDGQDGQRKPIWNFVEVSHPFSEAPPDSPNITDAQINAAVWHSIIAGARGIIYFQHSFGVNQPCYGDHHTLRSDCHGHRAQVTATNAQVKSLASVLNSPTVTSGLNAPNNVKVLGKLSNNQLYIFAGSRENVSSNATFTVQSGSSVTVIGENRTIPITNNQFTDSFANGNTIHIYRVN